MLADAIRSFAANLSALREFVTLIGSLLDDHSQQLRKQHSRDLIPFMIAAAMLDKNGETSALEGEVDRLKKEFGGDVVIEPNPEGSGCRIFVPEEEAQRRFMRATEAVRSGHQHRSLLYRSSLISLVSAAEWFTAQVLRHYYTKYPDAAGLKDKTLTLADLRGFTSVADAERYLVELRIDEIMRGSLEDWLKVLADNVKLHMGYITPHRDALVEVFQRRNVVIHNDGVVHPSYVAKVAPTLREGVEIGQRLPIDAQYLEKSIDLIELNFILIAAELWKQLEPKDDERAAVLTTNVVMDRMLDERWSVAEGLSRFAMADKQIPERDQLIARMNFWQCVKWQGRFEEVKPAIQGEDMSAKDELFQLARYVLLDDFDQALEMLPRIIDSEKMTLTQLKEWPIFRELRKTVACETFIGGRLAVEYATLALPVAPTLVN